MKGLDGNGFVPIIAQSFRGKKLETVSLQTGKVQAVEPAPTPDE